MTADDLRSWVLNWAAEYPVEQDDVLSPLVGQPFFTPEQVEILIRWKYPPPLSGRRLYRLNNITRLFEKNARDEVIARTRLAFQSDDRDALKEVTHLEGIGTAIGSTILMAQCPDRYTVFDNQASKTLLNLGRIDRQEDWITYLRACRTIAQATGLPLRTVDRALFTANGSTSRLSHERGVDRMDHNEPNPNVKVPIGQGTVSPAYEWSLEDLRVLWSFITPNAKRVLLAMATRPQGYPGEAIDRALGLTGRQRGGALASVGSQKSKLFPRRGYWPYGWEQNPYSYTMHPETAKRILELAERS